jgi:hypothetical protein
MSLTIEHVPWITDFCIFQNLLKAQHVSSGIPLLNRSTKLYLQPLVYIHIWWPAVVQPGQRPVTTWVYKPEAADTVWSSWWWAVCRSKRVEPSVNFGIINSITRLHLVGYDYWFILRCTYQWIYIYFFLSTKYTRLSSQGTVFFEKDLLHW